MNPFDSAHYADQTLSREQHQARKASYPSQTAGASTGLHPGQASNNVGIRLNMPQTGEVNQSSRQNPRGQQTSVNFGAAGENAMGTYQFNPSINQSNVPAPSNMLYTANNTLPIQQFPQNPYQGVGNFHLGTVYDPSLFAPPVDPMASFEQNYPDAANFQGSDMNFVLAYNASTPSQSLDMFLSSTYRPLPQLPMDPPPPSAQLTSLGSQQNWVDLSDFNQSLPRQSLQNASVGDPPLENSLVALPQSNQSVTSQSHPISSYVQPHSTTTTVTSPIFRNPFIPPAPGIAVSATPKPGASKETSGYRNLYSKSGFDMFGILAEIANRQNPEINIGAVDMSCAFIICDIMTHDDPIVYVSEAFEHLTGYTKDEIIGQNCRFLQSPDGKVVPGSKRRYVDDQTVFQVKEKIQARAEVQVSMINYRKGGQSFVNILTMIPVKWNASDYRFYVGFQVDIVEQPHAVTRRSPDGSYSVNYHRDQLSRYVMHAPESRGPQTNKPKNTIISHNEVASVLRIIGAEFKDNRMLDRFLLENSDDVIHVLSVKGRFLYLSQSSSKLLEYDPSELVGRSISSVCHPSDIAPVTRELKQSTIESPVSIVYRFRRKDSGYVWFESYGSLHIEPGKGRKSLILVGRQRPVYVLDRSSIHEAGGIGENDLWAKISISGLFLFVSSNARGLLDRTPADMVGKGIQEFMRNDSQGELAKALEVARTGLQATFKHEIRHKRGHVLQAQTVLFPGDAIPGSKPSFLIARIYLLKNSRSTYLQQRGSSGIISSTTTDMNVPGAMTTTASAPTTTASATQPSLPNPGGTQSTPKQGPTSVLTGAGTHSLPLGTQDEAILSSTNIFEELKTVRSSSWQFELRQLERNNRLLAEELQGLLSRRKKRKRKKGTGPLEKACTNCGTRNTPEWRRGPSGDRDLCNSCGLRWAKQNGRISPRKQSDQLTDKNSSPASARTSPRNLTDERSHEKFDGS